MTKVAIVTGGGSGIGLGISRLLARNKYHVAIISRSKKCIESARSISDEGFFASGYQCDINDVEAVNDTFLRISESKGVPNLLINNAGIVNAVEAKDMQPSVWEEVIKTNLSGAFYCSQNFANLAIRHSRAGSIVNISSICAQTVVYPFRHVHYNVSKAGLEMMTKSLAAEWAQYDIRVNAIAPGFIATEMTSGRENIVPKWLEHTPQKRFGSPDDIAKAVLFLAKDSGFTTGSVFTIDGGHQCL